MDTGWRLRRSAWGRRYAREGVAASLDWACANTAASWGLMIRLGMARQAALDFDHPSFAPGHPLSRHLVYTMERLAGE